MHNQLLISWSPTTGTSGATTSTSLLFAVSLFEPSGYATQGGLINCPHQAQHFKELKTCVGVDSSTDCYKPMRHTEILRSEQSVVKVIDVLENEYLKPPETLKPCLDNDKLYNLSSGVPKEDGVDEPTNIDNWEIIPWSITQSKNSDNLKCYSDTEERQAD